MNHNVFFFRNMSEVKAVLSAEEFAWFICPYKFYDVQNKNEMAKIEIL